MRIWNKLAAGLLTLVLAAGLSACTIPMPGFADYDVSGYIKALLDSSYHAEHDEFMAVANVTEEAAQGNNTTTMENAAVSFCNTYGVSPSDAQLLELQKVMRQAFALTKYTVKEEKKVDGGYYLEVEISPIVNFSGRKSDIDKLKEEAAQEATYINTSEPSSLPGEEGDGGYGEGEETPEEPEPQPSQTVDANELFVDKVLEFCKQELANIRYDSQSRSLPLDIVQTDKGELQLDLNQIDAIDKNAVLFS